MHLGHFLEIQITDYQKKVCTCNIVTVLAEKRHPQGKSGFKMIHGWLRIMEYQNIYLDVGRDCYPRDSSKRCQLRYKSIVKTAISRRSQVLARCQTLRFQVYSFEVFLIVIHYYCSQVPQSIIQNHTMIYLWNGNTVMTVPFVVTFSKW